MKFLTSCRYYQCKLSAKFHSSRSYLDEKVQTISVTKIALSRRILDMGLRNFERSCKANKPVYMHNFRSLAPKMNITSHSVVTFRARALRFGTCLPLKVLTERAKFRKPIVNNHETRAVSVLVKLLPASRKTLYLQD
jgi:hypothetical protein